MHYAGGAAASVQRPPHVGFKREDDATRHGRKGSGSATDLIKILSTLYKGEEEEFLRVNP